MKIALVHDQLNEFGGAERVLLALSRIWPDAPIYTAYYVKNSPAWERFKDKDIRVSPMQHVWRLASPLRFLAPHIWNRFDFSEFDVIIGSSSWYVTKGFKKKGNAIEICYCHTPPRWLYGYRTSMDWRRNTLIRLYGDVVGFFMRHYDFDAAQRVDYFIANSIETQRRITKFYRRESTVIYPPISLSTHNSKPKIRNPQPYYLFVSRPVGSKGLELAEKAAEQMGFYLKVVGYVKNNTKHIEYLGHVSDEELAKLYSEAKAFLALATDEDFGMTPVEAMVCGTPVIGIRSGGYIESVVDGKTGILFDDSTVEGLISAIKVFEQKRDLWKEPCVKHASNFDISKFDKIMRHFVESAMNE